jgi:hypothetical protein
MYAAISEHLIFLTLYTAWGCGSPQFVKKILLVDNRDLSKVHFVPDRTCVTCTGFSQGILC